MATATTQFRAERVDDIPLLLGFLQKMDLPNILEKHLGTHHLHQGLSNGWLATVWLAFILSEANHCKVSVQDWAHAHHHTLTTLLGQPPRDVEFSDDRLSIILRRLHDTDWQALEASLWNGTCQVYEIPLELIRLDATTSYGYHEITPEGLLQLGHSKDHRPDLPQFKLMAAAAQPTSQLIACDVAPGNSADDPLYLPLIERVRTLLNRTGLLYAGDTKMAAWETRAAIASRGDFYLVPLPRTGDTAHQWDGWIEDAVAGRKPLQDLQRTTEADAEETFARGYEFTRDAEAVVGGKTVRWKERVQVLRSLALAERQAKQLDKHVRAAADRLRRLTPPPGRGIRPYVEEGALREAIRAILEPHDLHGLLRVEYARESPPAARGTRRRPRYVITKVERLTAAITARQQRLGWRVQVTNLSKAAYGLLGCVLLYNGGWSVERDFHLLKDRPLGIQPLYVREEEQILGLVRLLTIALRVQTLLELVVRGRLEERAEELPGLYEGQPKRQTNRPTAVRLLKAVSRMNISVIEVKAGNDGEWHVTPLPPLLPRVLSLVGVPVEIYTKLASNTG